MGVGSPYSATDRQFAGRASALRWSGGQPGIIRRLGEKEAGQRDKSGSRCKVQWQSWGGNCTVTVTGFLWNEESIRALHATRQRGIDVRAGNFCVCAQRSHRQTHGSRRSGGYYRGVGPQRDQAHNQETGLTHKSSPRWRLKPSVSTSVCLFPSLPFPSLAALFCLAPATLPFPMSSDNKRFVTQGLTQTRRDLYVVAQREGRADLSIELVNRVLLSSSLLNVCVCACVRIADMQCESVEVFWLLAK